MHPFEDCDATMDVYTKETKAWLDDRFRQVDAEGVYRAHQPIYGFQWGPVPPNIKNYIRIYEILRKLTRLDFDSFLDVGGAEGYTANLVRRFFGSEVRSCDLSSEVCA